MSASTPVPSSAGAWPVPQPVRGVASRVVAGALHFSAGFMLTASVLGIGVAHQFVSRGVVVASAADVALLESLVPVIALFGLLGLGHIAAALGMVFGSRTAAGLGIGLGALDVVAGVVMLVVAAGSTRGRDDGVGIAMTFVVAGVVLAVAARAADWNTHGPTAEA